jgi:GTP cyclohydrolase II
MIRTAQAGTVRRVVSTRLLTRWGMFQTLGFERDISNGSRWVETACPRRTDRRSSVAAHPFAVLHRRGAQSLCCDYNEQLELAMRAIAEEGHGLVIYELQEGRGIGLIAKLQAYALQDSGLDTVDANHALGFMADCRDFSLPAAIPHDLAISRVRLLSINPRKTRALIDAGIEIVAQIPCQAVPTSHSIP